MRSTMQTVYLALAVLLTVGLVVQVFLAGLGVFDGPERFAMHRDFGFTLSILPLAMIVVGLIGRVGRRQVGLAALILVLFFVQSILVGVRGQMPAVAALHPVNGFLILFLSIVAARDAWIARRTAAPATAPS